MIIRASEAFAKQFKCDLSPVGQAQPAERQLDSWSCHFIRLGRKPVVVAMNDATLYTLLIPAKGVKSFEEIWMRLVAEVFEIWTEHGGKFDPNNQTVMVVKRTDRSLVAVMNQVIQSIRWQWAIHGDDLDLLEVQTHQNYTPMATLGFKFPSEELGEHLNALSEDDDDLDDF
jgi:hypothetical protein